MTADQHLKILCIDDNKDIIQTLVGLLTREGYLVYSATDPRQGIAIAQRSDPDLILLDIMMPGMNGYELCKVLQQGEQTSKIPVVFLSALNQPQHKVSALAAGGVDYLTKPFERDSLMEVTKRYAGKKAAWGACLKPQGLRPPPRAGAKGNYTLANFKLHVIDKFKPGSDAAKAVTALTSANIYKLAGILGITPSRVARLIAEFSNHTYFPVINPDDIKLGVLPAKFAEQNNIAVVEGRGEATLLAISQPFNLELHDMIRSILGSEFEFGITEPSNISFLYRLAQEPASDFRKVPGAEDMYIAEEAVVRLRTAAKSANNEINEPHIKYLTGKLLQFLAEEKGAQARIEAQGACYQVKAGAPNAPEDFTRLNMRTGNMVMARLKAMAGMDILERRNPQKGAFAVISRTETCRLSLATEVSENGESLVLTPSA